MSLHDKHVRQLEAITEDLRRVKLKIGLLADMQGLTGEQANAVESLLRGLNGVRGCEMGITRQAFGLDQDLVRAARAIARKNVASEKG